MPKFSEDILRSFEDKEYRHKFIQSLISENISSQIRAMRTGKRWTQTDLAGVSGKPQSVISRIESTGYGKLALKTIYDIAEALDVAVQIRYVSFSDFIRGNQDLSWEALSCKSYEDDDLSIDALYRSTIQLPSENSSIPQTLELEEKDSGEETSPTPNYQTARVYDTSEWPSVGGNALRIQQPIATLAL